jgi:aspartate aminotransferase/aspartate/glutamate/aspartate-prephenate aminotransferase
MPDISYFFGMVTPEGKVIESAEDLCMNLLEVHNVALVPGEAFGYPEAIRISYATSMDVLQKCMERIAECIRALKPSATPAGA